MTRRPPIVAPKPAAPPLLVAQKMEAVIEYGYIALRDFPRTERHVMSQEIRLAMWSILRGLIYASKYPRHRTPAEELGLHRRLRQLDGDIELLRRQLRLAMSLTYLPLKRYEVWSRRLNEVGAIVGTWRLKLQAREGQSAWRH